MACFIAVRQSVLFPGFAPYFKIEKSFLAKAGGTIFFRSAGKFFHHSSSVCCAEQLVNNIERTKINSPYFILNKFLYFIKFNLIFIDQ
jgi:hypothetical protein